MSDDKTPLPQAPTMAAVMDALLAQQSADELAERAVKDAETARIAAIMSQVQPVLTKWLGNIVTRINAELLHTALPTDLAPLPEEWTVQSVPRGADLRRDCCNNQRTVYDTNDTYHVAIICIITSHSSELQAADWTTEMRAIFRKELFTQLTTIYCRFQTTVKDQLVNVGNDGMDAQRNSFWAASFRLLVPHLHELEMDADVLDGGIDMSGKCRSEFDY